MPEKPVVSSVTRIQDSLHGYLSADLSPPSGHGFGASFYVTIWALLESPLSMFQVGLPSTWIQPENFDFRLPLCPKGTFARDEAEKEKQANRPGDWSEQEKVFLEMSFKPSKAVSVSGGLRNFQLSCPSIESTAFRIATPPR
jgi:hypothetical protein